MAEASRASRSTVGAHLLGRQHAGVQHLQHHRPLQQRVVGLVDHAAAAGAQPPQNLVMCNRLAFHRCLSSLPAIA